MRVLVTGGTGYLGRAIVRSLVARGHEPVVFARGASGAGLPGRAVDGDVRDRAALVAAARGCDALCHTAALVSVWRPRARDFDDINVGGLENALAAARDAGIARIAYTSSFLALPPGGRAEPIHGNDYQRTKAAALVVARRACDAGAPIVTLVPGVIYGPGIQSEGNLIGQLLADHVAGRLPGVIGGERIWSFSWIDHVAAAHVAALERGEPGAVYRLGGEDAPQIRPFEILRDVRGTPLPRRLPVWAGIAAGALDELRAALTGHPPRLTRRTVDIFRADWPLDSQEAGRALGYRVQPLADGIRRILSEIATPESH